MKQELKPFEEWPFRAPSIEKAVASTEENTKKLQGANDANEAIAIYKKQCRLMDAFQDKATHIEVLYSIDTQNKKYAKAMNALMEGLPLAQNAAVAFQKAMVESPHRAAMEKKLGANLFQMYEYSLKGFDSRIIEDSIEENKLTMQYDALIASAKIPFRGEIYNLTQMGKFLQDDDRKIREEAASAYYGYLETIQDQIEDIYDKLVHVRDKMAKTLGYKNFVELGYIHMSRYDYDAKDVEAYREQIHDIVTPIASKIMKAQFKRVGIRRPKVYDMNVVFADGNPIPKGTTEEKVEAAKKMYDALSPETSYFFRYMADHHVMDLEAKPGKQQGGYMTYFPIEKIPFIFSNFNGTAGDVDVLTHEFGHSFQAYLARSIKIPEYRSPTMEGCEIDSMSMEFFAEPYMDLFFDEPTKYRYKHLADSISFLPYGVTVDEFQHWVYENPDATPEQRDAKWHELELKYTPYKVACYEGCPYMMKGHRWLTQAHIFSSPFYYIDYTLAQVMAFEYFNLDRKNHELAWKRYLKICKLGGKYPFRTLVKKAHMKDPFTPGVVKSAVRPLVKVLSSYDVH